MTHYLKFIVSTLRLVKMWPEGGNAIQQYYVMGLVGLSTIPVMADLILLIAERASFSSLNEDFVALSALYAVVYVSYCFISRKSAILALVEDLNTFEAFTPKSQIQQTDDSIQFYTKLFIVYGLVGNILYGLLPFLNFTSCQHNRPAHMIKYGVPCGLIVRMVLPFTYDDNAMFQVIVVHEIIVCCVGTTALLVVTMLICGTLMHVTAQLKHLKTQVRQLSYIKNPTTLHKRMNFCVRFHAHVVDYATRADACFNRMMLLHITWTGFIISILGFEISKANSVQALRYGMHLFGWLAMLFIVCHHGQNMMDQSFDIAHTAYAFGWYNAPTLVQKYVVLIMLRSQRELTLKAAGLQVMSLATFLGVLYTAYSYFTLLLKLN